MLPRARSSYASADEAVRSLATAVNAALGALPFECTFTAYTSGSIAKTPGVYLVDATEGAVTFQLPSAVSLRGKGYIVKKVDSGANAVTVTCALSETIDGAGTESLAAQYDAVFIVSDGANWHAVARI